MTISNSTQTIAKRRGLMLRIQDGAEKGDTSGASGYLFIERVESEMVGEKRTLAKYALIDDAFSYIYSCVKDVPVYIDTDRILRAAISKIAGEVSKGTV